MTRLLLITSSLVLSLSSFSSYAANPFKDNTEITIGGFFPAVDTSARIDSNSGSVGDTLDFEDVFGLDENDSSIFGGIEYRFNDRHAIEATYFNLNRDASKTLSSDVTLGDETYTVGSAVDSKFDYSVYRASYIYNALTTEDYAIGVALGLHITDVDLAVKAQLSSGSTTVSAESEISQMTIPLPVLGLRANWRIAENWIIDSTLDGFALSYDDYDGYLFNFGAAIEYDRFEHVSIGAGWDYYNLNLEADKNNFNGEIDYEYSGPTVYLKGRF